MMMMVSQCQSDQYFSSVVAEAGPLHYQSHLDSHTPGYLRFRVEGVKGVKN